MLAGDSRSSSGSATPTGGCEGLFYGLIDILSVYKNIFIFCNFLSFMSNWLYSDEINAF